MNIHKLIHLESTTCTKGHHFSLKLIVLPLLIFMSLSLMTSCSISKSILQYAEESFNPSPIEIDRSAFRVNPYVQNPSQSEMTIKWFSNSANKGQLTFQQKVAAQTTTNEENSTNETVTQAIALGYPEWENTTYFGGNAPVVPFMHRVRLSGLKSGTEYLYTVVQDGETFTSSFTTAPVADANIRVTVYGDSETEPESTGKFVKWEPVEESHKDDKSIRRYLVDQTQGYKNNLDLIKKRSPDIILIAGDLVQAGGEQRDWDEFWNQINNDSLKLASTVPVIPAIGNHEYSAGPKLGHSSQPASENAVSKYKSYFESPTNNDIEPEHEGRYFRFKYGPATFIMLDVNNNSPEDSDKDTSLYIGGAFNKDNDNGLTTFAPGFEPDSIQVQWLEKELEKAQQDSHFIFIVFHQSPYSSGPHGQPPGFTSGHNPQSGVPARALTKIFMKYGVDAVLNGHDEMWERSIIKGFRVNEKGDSVAHSIYFYDVGIGGDGLRAPHPGVINSAQAFIAGKDAPEKWIDGELISGGRHYGHLELDITHNDTNQWQATFTPVYVLPIKDENGQYTRYQRMLYNDLVIIKKPALKKP